MPDENKNHRYITASDGLRLHYVEYGAREDPGVPVVCLPGFTRNVDDFDVFARGLRKQDSKPRRVLALDYRGRGDSDYDKNWRQYSVIVENSDILAVLTAAEVDQAIFIGTSRGGLHIMALGAVKPTLLKAVILNDVGPVLDGLGLIRIKNYVGKTPPPASWEDAEQKLRKANGQMFKNLSEENWRDWTRVTWREKNGKLYAPYDPALGNTLSDIGRDAPPIDLWPLFLGLSDVPTLILRGSESDLLSQKVYEEMLQRHPKAEGLVVADQGHAPLLINDTPNQQIFDFCQRNSQNPWIAAGEV